MYFPIKYTVGNKYIDKYINKYINKYIYKYIKEIKI